MEGERRASQLSEKDVERIADAVVKKSQHAFFIEAEEHYNAHKRMDRLLTAYDDATSAIRKTLLGLIIVGLLVLAGLGAAKH